MLGRARHALAELTPCHGHSLWITIREVGRRGLTVQGMGRRRSKRNQPKWARHQAARIARELTSAVSAEFDSLASKVDAALGFSTFEDILTVTRFVDLREMDGALPEVVPMWVPPEGLDFFVSGDCSAEDLYAVPPVGLMLFESPAGDVVSPMTETRVSIDGLLWWWDYEEDLDYDENDENDDYEEDDEWISFGPVYEPVYLNVHVLTRDARTRRIRGKRWARSMIVDVDDWQVWFDVRLDLDNPDHLPRLLLARWGRAIRLGRERHGFAA